MFNYACKGGTGLAKTCMEDLYSPFSLVPGVMSRLTIEKRDMCTSIEVEDTYRAV